MGYNLKTPWDLAELKKEAIPVIAPIVGSSSFGAHRDCFVDLKLGRFGDPGEGLAEKLKAPQVSVMEPSSSRKSRARSNMAQAASCLVDGCRSDLSTCRDYHRRHKVCEAHSKTAIVTIGGQERRFCQQCSRFHSLVEFDDGKRSCRKRLDGHNRRRRKPQPEPITLNPARFLSNHQGARYLPFSNQQACAASSPYSSGWAGVMKTENDPILDNTNSHSFVSFADHKNTLPGGLYGDSVSQAFHDPTVRSNQKMFVDGVDRIIGSDRAFSLLSSPPTSKSREFGFGNFAQTSSSQSPHSLISSFNHDNNIRPQDEPEPTAPTNVMGPQGTLRSGLDGSAGMPHQTLFFSWE